MAESILGLVYDRFDWFGVTVTFDKMGDYAIAAGPGWSHHSCGMALGCIDISYRHIVRAYLCLSAGGHCIDSLVRCTPKGHILALLSMYRWS